MQIFPVRTAVLSAFITATLLAAPSLSAQEQGAERQGDTPTKQQGQGEQAQTQQFSEQKLESFAAAYTEVDKIAQKHSKELKSAEDKDQALKVQEKVNAKMEEAIKAEGLSTQEFNQVVKAVKQDAEVRQRVAQLLNEKQ